MKNTDVKNLIKLGIKILGGAGAAKIVRNISPYEGIFGSIACGTFAFFASMAAVDLIDEQLLQCEKILENMNNGGGMVIV